MIRNSWGEYWGDKGYIRIQRKYCGVDSTPKDGTGCPDGPPTVTACDSYGVLYDTAFSTGGTRVSSPV